MSSFGSKDNQIHVSNYTSKNIYVAVADDPRWEMVDLLFDLFMPSPVFKGFSIIKRVMDIPRALKAIAKVAKQADAVKSSIENSQSVTELITEFNAIKSKSQCIPPGQVLKVNEKFLGNPLNYLSTNGWRALIGVEDVILTIWNEDNTKAVQFNTNGDYSWRANEDAVVRVKYGSLWEEDPYGKTHAWNEGSVVLSDRPEKGGIFERDHPGCVIRVKPSGDGYYPHVAMNGTKQVIRNGRYILDDYCADGYPDNYPDESLGARIGRMYCLRPVSMMKVSSVVIEEGQRVILYENNFSGRWVCVTHDTEDLDKWCDWFCRSFVVDLDEREIGWHSPVCSPNGNFVLRFQPDGNLVLSFAHDAKLQMPMPLAVPLAMLLAVPLPVDQPQPDVRELVRWATNTHAKGRTWCVRQRDGVLVIRNSKKEAIWASGVETGKQAASNLVVQDDGNVVIVDPNGKKLWESGSTLTLEEFQRYHDPEYLASRRLLDSTPPFGEVQETPPLVKATWTPPPPPPGLLTLLTPAPGATNVSTSPVVTWAEFSGAKSYSLNLFRVGHYQDEYIGTTSTTATCFSATGTLHMGALYNWIVRAYDQAGLRIGESVWGTFTTVAPPAPVLVPKLTWPADDSYEVETSKLVMWNLVDVEAYEVDVSQTQDFSKMVRRQTCRPRDEGQQGGGCLITDLRPDTRYYWRVRGCTISGPAPWSETFTFSTGAKPVGPAPATPTIVSPVGGEAVQLPPTLRWSASPGAKSYGLVVSLTADFSSKVFDQSVGDFTDWAISSLQGNTNYYWKVVAMNGQAASAFSSVGSFKTGAKAPPPNLKMWGENSYNRLNMPEDLGLVKKVTAGPQTTLALRADGTVRQWGNTRVDIPAGTVDVMDCAAGEAHIVLLQKDGSVRVLGDNARGQLNTPAGLSGVKAVSAGKYHTLALLGDGSVKTWGGLVEGIDKYALGTMPPVLTGKKVKAIAAGGKHSVALLENGTVVAWGGGNPGAIEAPVSATGVMAIAAGADHVVALKEDGTVLQWGDSGAESARDREVLKDVIAIAAAADQSLALKKDGTVVEWGADLSTELVLPGGLSQKIPHPLAQKQAAIANAIEVSLGSRHAVVRIELAEETANRLARSKLDTTSPAIPVPAAPVPVAPGFAIPAPVAPAPSVPTPVAPAPSVPTPSVPAPSVPAAPAVPAPVGDAKSGVDLALGKSVTASSCENSSCSASMVVDANANSRWSSLYQDPAWITVDLGSSMAFNRVVLRWEAAYGRVYEIQTSNDNQTWTPVYTQKMGAGGVESLSFPQTTARFVRMFGTARGTPWGYSLWSFEIYNGAAPSDIKTTVAPTPIPIVSGQALEGRSRKGNVAGSIMDGNPRSYVVTYDGTAQAEDWYSRTFATATFLQAVTFYHGHCFHDGGWFDVSQGRPRIEVKRTTDAAWEKFGELSSYPATTATNSAGLQDGQAFVLTLTSPVVAAAVRVVGKPACGDNPRQSFSSCGELMTR